MNHTENALRRFVEWYDKLKFHKSAGGPARGTIGNALVVLERLKTNYDLRLESHRAATGRSQIKGASGASSLRTLLETYNNRTSQVETDQSILIEIPKNLPR
jgi:hypothetical protein